MKNTKQHKDGVQLILNGLESGLTELIDKTLKRFSTWLVQKLNREEKKDNISIQMLSTKEKWTHPDAFAFSLSRNKEISLAKVDLNKHSIVAGATGAGKNVTFDNIMHEYFKMDIPVVFIDPKGDFGAMQRFVELNNKQNRKCYIFSENYYLSNKCNPILEGDVTTIVERVFSIFEWGEQYYADVNYIALFTAVNELKKKNEKISLEKILIYIETFINNKETKNIINKLSKITRSSFGKILSAEVDAITFSRIREEGASVYIGLSTLGYPAISQAIGKLFVYELMHHSYECFTEINKVRISHKMPLAVFIDELGSVITQDFISLVNKCRGAGVALCVSFQLLGDLDKIGKTFRDQLIGNFNNFFIGHTHIPSEAEYWAKIIPTISTKKKTYQMDEESETGRKSVRDVEEFRVHPNVFKSLGVGQFVIASYFPHQFIDVVKIYNKLDAKFYLKKNKDKDAVSKVKLEENLTESNIISEKITKEENLTESNIISEKITKEENFAESNIIPEKITEGENKWSL